MQQIQLLNPEKVLILFPVKILSNIIVLFEDIKISDLFKRHILYKELFDIINFCNNSEE